jgi:hypothetical protein
MPNSFCPFRPVTGPTQGSGRNVGQQVAVMLASRYIVGHAFSILETFARPRKVATVIT